LRNQQLPFKLHIWHVEPEYDAVRAKAFNQKIEWGSCLVWDRDRLRLPHPARGWAEGVSPVCEPAGHNLYAGFAHVHLPDSISGRQAIRMYGGR